MARFTDIFLDVTKDGRKIPKENYLSQGKYPIIDQGQEYISGFSNESDGLYENVPAIIFGDHTRIIKYVDTPFFLGADGVKLLKAKVPNSNYKYLYYALSHAHIPNTGYNRHFKWLKEVDIRLPNPNEQQYIVEILDRLGNLISLRKQQLAKLDELVKARFLEMFGDPVSNPMKWEMVPLSKNATLLNGRAYSQDELLDTGKYPVLRVGNFFSNRGWYYSNLELEDDKYCDNGDLLYAWSASFGARIWNGRKVIYHYHIWKILVGTAYCKEFLCKLLDYVTDSLMNDTHGIAMMHLTKSGMEQTPMIVPPLDLQEQFSVFVQRISEQKLTIQQSLDKMEVLKKALMQEYFGEAI